MENKEQFKSNYDWDVSVLSIQTFCCELYIFRRNGNPFSYKWEEEISSFNVEYIFPFDVVFDAAYRLSNLFSVLTLFYIVQYHTRIHPVGGLTY